MHQPSLLGASGLWRRRLALGKAGAGKKLLGTTYSFIYFCRQPTEGGGAGNFFHTHITKILLPSAVHLEERLTVSQSVSSSDKQSVTQSVGQAGRFWTSGTAVGKCRRKSEGAFPTVDCAVHCDSGKGGCQAQRPGCLRPLLKHPNEVEFQSCTKNCPREKNIPNSTIMR
jgi:hypothetical protein